MVHKKRCVLESVENGTNAGLGRSGSHYHLLGEDRPEAMPHLLMGLLLRDPAQSWQIGDGALRAGESRVLLRLLTQMTVMNR